MSKINLRFLKNFLTISVISGCLFMIEGCGEEDTAVPSAGEVVADVPASATPGATLTFLDRSENVATRAWTIQDGDPATSTNRSVSVVFESTGEKSVVLDVVFENGTTNSATYTIDIQDLVTASFTSVQTPLAVINDPDMPKNADIQYSVEFNPSVTGTPDSYAWTFPGGTPETSTDERPVVTWMDGDAGTVTVSLVVSRSSDSQSVTFEEEVTVGSQSILNPLWWNFESDTLMNYLTWQAPGAWDEGALTLVDDGFKGKAVKIIYPGGDVNNQWSLFTRDITEANGSLLPGSVVLFSYYVKAETNVAVDNGFRFWRIANHVPDFVDLEPKQDYKNIGFVGPQGATTEWQRFSHLDTIPDWYAGEALANAYPHINFADINGTGNTFYLDEVEIKVIQE